MRLVSYRSQAGPRSAAVKNGRYIDLNQADPSLPTSMKQLLAGGPSALSRAAAAISAGKPIDPSGVRLVAPVPDPEKIICIGLNYADHAAESGVPAPPEPVVFNKFLTAVEAHGDEITLPSASQQVDYEAELVVVIGAGGKNISRADAFEHVAGYTCGHDVSARDWQLRKPGGQWLLGKTFDGFAPFGPELVTADEIAEPGRLDIRLRLNGETMQDSNTRQLIFPIDELIAYVSRICTLSPGDVIFTGTPPGVGMARKPPVFLKPGDVVEIEIEKIGTLRNVFVAERA
jgi:2-keto-4-pentenoate hydratase/2-oxohepta-3-ene-1,7-dioic acid hydratase in catechol pathway